jgi:hypothetical protein
MADGTANIFHIAPPQGPEKGGNSVTIVGSGFTASRFAACRFGESVAHARYISETEIECIAPKSAVAHSVVEISLTSDGSDWTSSSYTYRYLPMLQIYDISPPRLPTDVPHTIHITGENFQYPSEMTCKLGSTISSKALVISNDALKCFIPPIHQPGKATLDILDDGGHSMVELSLDTSVMFYDPIYFRISPSFGSIVGGTVVTVFLDSAISISADLWRNYAQLMCRFSLINESPIVIDTAVVPLNDTLLSCVTPNVTNASPNDDDHIYTTMSLISRGMSLPVSFSFPFMFKKIPAVKSLIPSLGKGTLVRVTGDGPGIWLNSSLLTCAFGEEEGEARWVAPLVVDGIAPAPYHVSTIVTVSENGIDTSDSTEVFSFHPDPVVTSVEPSFGLSLNDTIVTLLGNGFSGRDAPMCGFVVRNDKTSVHTTKVEGRVISETIMECLISLNTLAPSEYACMASNNGGIEWGLAGARFRSVLPPSIISLTPTSGIESAFGSVAVSGNNLAIEGSQHTHCVLLDHAGSQMGTSLAEIVNSTLVNCPIQCPSYNKTAMYSLAVSLNGMDQVHTSSMASFWCCFTGLILTTSS